MSIREELGDDYIFFDNPSYDTAIIGTPSTGQVIYDFDKMVAEIAQKEQMDEEEATDFVSYNTVRALDYFNEPNKPIVMYGVSYE